MNPVMVVNLFKDKSARGDAFSITSAEAILNGLARSNAQAFRLYNLPSLYASGVRYKREPRGREYWKGYQQILRDRFADCDDLSAARVGELIATGVDPGARVYIYRTGPTTLHAVVKRSSGRIEDPSKRLGMGQP
jgi:hypothetical protein